MLDRIKQNIDNNIPLSKQELIFAYDLDLLTLANLADKVRRRINGNFVHYVKNFHLEPSNICIHKCEFCSYRRENIDDKEAWSMNIDQVIKHCKSKFYPGVSQIHIVGSVHPERKFSYYKEIVKVVHDLFPEVEIKAYSAIEILNMSKEFQPQLGKKESLIKVLSELKEAGLKSLPGGGAEILKDEIREKICPDKPMTDQWIEVHYQAHKLGIQTGATMLFGHIEDRYDRIDHLLKIRDLQNQTSGFKAFIPLKYHSSNNLAAKKYDITEVSDLEILRTIAISRIALQNIKHIKAYWPMLGQALTEQSLLFGADDIDGTIQNSTKIYSLAGSSEQNPEITEDRLRQIAASAGFQAKLIE